MVESIGRSDEGRELVVVWVSSDDNIRNLQQNKDNLAKIADPRGLTADQIRQLIATTKPQYHLMGGLHSGETGPSEMLMELLPPGDRDIAADQTNPRQRDRFDHASRRCGWTGSQRRLVLQRTRTPGCGQAPAPARRRTAAQVRREITAKGNAGAKRCDGSGQDAATGGGGAALPYWGKYVFHDNNRDINLSQVSMRAIVDWYFTAHPPIMHDLHEAQPLLYTYSGGPPQNPNLDPILFAELPFFANFELEQMTKWGMPGVYTHAFMDGWSPGYLGSVAYNHNGMMRMYETQSGRENEPGAGDGSSASTPSGSSGARSAGPPNSGSSILTAREPLDGSRAGRSRRRRPCNRSIRSRRIATTRVVSRPADSTGCSRQFLTPQ